MQDVYGEVVPELIEVLHCDTDVWIWEAGAELVRKEPSHA
jgi:hypothetical protein